MKLTKLALAAGVLSLGISTAHAQTYKTDFSTGIVLTSGTNTTNTLSLNFGALANKPLALSFPNGDTAGTYVLTSDGAGNLIWSGNAGNIILGGDATGPASNNIVNSASGLKFSVAGYEDVTGGQKVTGPDTLSTVSTSGLATLNAATITGNEYVGGGQHIIGADTVGGNLDIAGGTSVAGNDTVGGTLYANLGLTSNGGPTNISTTGNEPVDIGTNNNGSGGLITIGDSVVAGNVSNTEIAGNVSFTGPVNIPAGDLNLGLGNADIFVGNGASPSVATGVAMSGDVAIDNTGKTTVNSASGPKFSVTGYEDVTGGQKVTGPDTLSTVSTSGLATLNAATITGNEYVGGGQHIIGADTVGGNLDIAGGTSVAGNDTVLGTLYANGNANIDAAAAGNAGTITIGNSGNGGASPDSSVTTMNGAVNFTGPVNIPAGDLNLGLADDHFYIGSLGGAATPQTITQDVKITDAGVATVLSANGNFAVGGGQHVAGADTVGGNLDIAGGTSVAGNDTVGGTLYANLGLTSNGGPTNISTTGNEPVDIGTNNNGSGGLITIGDSVVAGNVSNTEIAGNVSFTGPVNIPAGDLNLGLGNADIFVGNGASPSVATGVAMSGDVAIDNTGKTTVNSASGPKFSVTGYEDVTGGQNVHGADTVVGQTTLGSTALSNGTVAAAATMALDGLHSYYSLTGTNPVSIGAITGAPAGQILVFVNTGTANFTLTGAGLLGAGTGDVIMTPGGSATLIYDGSNWHLLASN